MARTLPLLDAAQRREFDSPPKFTLAQRQLCFSLPAWAAPLLRAMNATYMRGGFTLSYSWATLRPAAVFSPSNGLLRPTARAYVQQRYRLGAVE